MSSRLVPVLSLTAALIAGPLAAAAAADTPALPARVMRPRRAAHCGWRRCRPLPKDK